MKNKTIPAIILLLGINFRVAYSQSECCSFGAFQTGTEPILTGELFAPTTQLDITTYFNAAWLDGDIYLADGGIIRNQKIKYNGLLDELLWLEPSSGMTIRLDKGAISRFHFMNVQGDSSVWFRKLKIKRDKLVDSSEIFGQEILSGKLSLFIQHYFYFERRESVQLNRRIYLKDIYREEPIFYVRYLSGRIVGFKRFSRRNLYAIDPGRKDLIRKYLNENENMKFNTIPEMRKVIDFLGSFTDQ